MVDFAKQMIAAQELVMAYADVLESSDGVQARPVEELPAGKQEIKEALLWWTLAQDRLGRLDQATLATTKAAYMSLADFQESVVQVSSALKRYRETDVETLDPRELAALAMEMAAEVSGGVANPELIRESNELGEEFDLRWKALRATAPGAERQNEDGRQGAGDTQPSLLRRLKRFVQGQG